jgi:outer membrane receptor protein involved in Fe transport
VRAQTSVRGLLTFNHHGTNPSETLTGNIWLDGTPYQRTENSAALSTQSRISSETREGALQDNNKIDWQHPIGKKEILSMSAEWDLVHLDHRYLFSSFDDLAFPREVSDQYRASQDTLAAYTTFQQTIGTWTFMPGVRLERNVRKISSAGSSVRIEHSELFPTLHVAHPFGKSLNLTLSYSKRIDRPLPEMLRPYQVVLDVLSIGTGNPALRDQSTDSYELNLQYRRKAVNFGVIVYNRQTSDVWSSSYTVNMAGQSVYTYVNAGTKRDSGAEFDLSTPIVKHLKVTGSINLFDSSVPVDGSGITVHQHQFRFTGNSTLEWDGPDREGKPGDIAQLQWQHESPAILYQFRNFSTNRVTLSYTHNVTKKWSVTAQADTKYLGSGHRVIAPLFQEYFADHDRWDFSVKLMKTFGAH